MKVHAEIQYRNEEGGLVHSDICPPYCSNDMSDAEYRQFLHECLDEWLNKSHGTGYFYIAEEGQIQLPQEK